MNQFITLGLLLSFVTWLQQMPCSSGEKVRGLSESNSGPIQVGDKHQIIVSPGTKSDVQPIKSGCTETYVITRKDASYISVHFRNFDLPEECSMDVTNGDGTQSSTLTGKGRAQQGTFWARHVTGDVTKLVLKCCGKTPGKKPFFEVDEYAAGYPVQNNSAAEPGARNLRRTSFLEAMNDQERLSICGTDDKRDAICYKNSHPALYEKARAVARLLMNGTGLCTGWLVSGSNLLFTNEHCISSQNTVLNTDFEFMREASFCGGGAQPGDVHDGTALLAVDASWDYALIQLDSSRNPAATYGYLELDNRTPPVGELLFIPQHPGGQPKKFGIVDTNESDDQCKVKGYRSGCAPSDMTYSCDTEGGSSGSPVLSRTNNKVVALHHCGGGCNGNLGAPIKEFYNDIVGYLGGTLSPTMSPVPCTGDHLTIAVTTDNYPSETAWTIKDDEDITIFSKNSFTAGTTTTTECLSPGCYTFEITDSYGDGICCGYGTGSYTVTLDGTEIKSGGAFGSSDSVEFCTDEPAPTSAPTASPTVSPTIVPTLTPSLSLPTSDTCISAGSNCLTTHKDPGCSELSCELKVCDVRDKCCTKKWGKKCQSEAEKLCTPCACTEDPDGIFLLKMKNEEPKYKTCTELQGDSAQKRNNICKKFHSYGQIQAARFVCPITCELKGCTEN